MNKFTILTCILMLSACTNKPAPIPAPPSEPYILPQNTSDLYVCEMASLNIKPEWNIEAKKRKLSCKKILEKAKIEHIKQEKEAARLYKEERISRIKAFDAFSLCANWFNNRSSEYIGVVDNEVKNRGLNCQQMMADAERNAMISEAQRQQAIQNLMQNNIERQRIDAENQQRLILHRMPTLPANTATRTSCQRNYSGSVDCTTY